MFLDYISGVIPELDLTGVQQATFEDLAWRILEHNYPLAKDEKFEMMLANSKNTDTSALRDKLIQAAHLKCSLAFKNIIKDFIDRKTDSFIESRVKEISLFNGEFKISIKEQVSLIRKNPLNKGIDAWKQNILFRLNIFLRSTGDDDYIPNSDKKNKGRGRASSSSRMPSYGTEGYLKKLKDTYYYNLAGKTDPEKTLLKKGYMMKKQQIEKEEKQFIQTYFADITKSDSYNTYRQMFAEYDWTNSLITDYSTITCIRSDMEKLFSQGQIEREDLASLCYLRYLLEGYDHLSRFQHIVVDEAQDISTFEFSILEMLSTNHSFSILGDIAQGIRSYRGITNCNHFIQEIFANENAKLFELGKSYRSTMEIVELANGVLPESLPHGIPVARRGEVPQIEKIISDKDKALRIEVLVKSLLEKEHLNSIAILTKTEKESEAVLALINNNWDKAPSLQMLKENTVEFKEGISIAPIAVVKGLEFDAVIIWDASDDNFPADLFHSKLLFIALSRPLHRLHILYTQTNGVTCQAIRL